MNGRRDQELPETPGMAAAAPLAARRLADDVAAGAYRAARVTGKSAVGRDPPAEDAAPRARPFARRDAARAGLRPASQPGRFSTLSRPLRPLDQRAEAGPGRRHRRPDHGRLPLRPPDRDDPLARSRFARRDLHAGKPR